MNGSLATTRREFLKLFGAAGVVAAIPATSFGLVSPEIAPLETEGVPAFYNNVVLNALRNGRWEQIGVVSDWEMRREVLELSPELSNVQFVKHIPALDFDVEATIVSPDMARIESLFEDRAEKFALVAEHFEYHIRHCGYDVEFAVASGVGPGATIHICGLQAEVMA